MLLDYSANIFNAAAIVAANKAHLYVRWVAIIDLTSYVIDLFKFKGHFPAAGRHLAALSHHTHFDIRPYISV